MKTILKRRRPTARKQSDMIRANTLDLSLIHIYAQLFNDDLLDAFFDGSHVWLLLPGIGFSGQVYVKAGRCNIARPAWKIQASLKACTCRR